MSYNNIHLFEFPTNLGLKKTIYAEQPGVYYLPSWLSQKGLHKALKPQEIYTLPAPPYTLIKNPQTGVNNTELIIDYAIRQSEFLLKHWADSPFKIVLGGDCSILLGTALGLKQKGHYGLVYIDGHTDYMGPELSQTGGAAGMDLAITTGYGHPLLTNIKSLSPYLQEEDVFCLGNREYDPEYVGQILLTNITYYDLENLRITGIREVASKFLKLIKKNNLDGFFVHLDLDVLNDDIMPAVDSRAADGLWYGELEDLLIPLLGHPKAVGIEITILDPDLDPDGKYTLQFVNNFIRILKNLGKIS